MLSLDTLIPGAWDLTSFFTNSTNYVQTAGGAFLILMGTVAIVYGGFLAIRKLMAGQQNQDSWVKIAFLIILGGALALGGWNLMSMVASGGQKTITDLGGGGLMLLLP